MPRERDQWRRLVAEGPGKTELHGGRRRSDFAVDLSRLDVSEVMGLAPSADVAEQVSLEKEGLGQSEPRGVPLANDGLRLLPGLQGEALRFLRVPRGSIRGVDRRLLGLHRL